MYSTLPHVFKNKFPFCLSVPSFIYPADYITNVRRLGPFVDEIELLLFESGMESLPSGEEINHLADLAIEMRVSYNVHLPIDLDLGTSHPGVRHEAVGRLASVLALVRPLKPTTHTLHLAYHAKDRSPESVVQWQAHTACALAELLAETAVPPSQISIETLDYPPAWLAPLVTRFDLSVCLDAGHIVRHGLDLQSTLALFDQRITICHLHGVDQDRDHLPLDKLPPEPRETLRCFLRNFKGSVSLEVFSLGYLSNSLACIAEMIPVEGQRSREQR